MPGFLDCVRQSWDIPSRKSSAAAVIADKLKTLRYDLKRWKTGLSKLKILIQLCNKVIFLLDELEDRRPLFTSEFNFRKLVKLHLEDLFFG